MHAPEPDERAPRHLSGALSAIHRTQSLLLVDFAQTCKGETGFIAVFRRWEEQLTALRLHILRAESRLLHLVGTERDIHDYHGARVDRESLSVQWVSRFTEWFASVRVNSTYRHLDSILDLDAEPVPADIITDLAIIAEVAESSMPALAKIEESLADRSLEDLAFYRVVAPWRGRGLPAMRQVERWLGEMLSELDAW